MKGLKESYGNPPYLVPELFLRVLTAAMGLALLGLIVVYLITGPLTGVDVAGTLICTPIVAYLVHLWLAPLDAR